MAAKGDEMGVSIIADSASDVSQETAKEWGISIIPLKIRFGEEEFLDGKTISNQTFYEKLTESGEFPKTSQISPADYSDYFEEEINKGNEVVCLTISSGVSGCVQSANIAAADYPGKVYVVDSMQFCISYYILVEYAKIMRDLGKSAKEIADEITRVREKSTVLSIFDTLEYLKAGGRLSSAAAFVGGILSIKPAITITNGVVDVFGKARGTKKGFDMLVKRAKELGGIDFNMPVIAGFTGISDEMLEKFLEESRELYEGLKTEIKKVSVGATIGTYAGPGAVAIAFFPNNS
ncbi:MAG: DegV family protein [Lachnospiraceae bacterium]|nr:DegV family protein [Lachnospiraceae bacterium]